MSKAPADVPRAGFALLFSLSMAQFMIVLDFTIVNVALPSIQPGLHVPTTTLQWLVSAYAVAFGGFLLLGGRLADVYGRARLYRIGLVVFVVASISGGLAVEPGLLIASRVVQGSGRPCSLPPACPCWSPASPGKKSAAARWAPTGRSSRRASRPARCSAACWSRSPGGWSSSSTSRSASRCWLPPCGCCRPILRGSGRQLDVPGAVTVTAGVASLVLAIARAGDTLQVTQPALLAAVAVLLLAAFVARERKARAPLLDLALLKDRGIAGANLTLIAVGAFSAGQVLLVTLYLQEGRGLSPVLTGLCFIPQAAGAFALSGPAGRLVPALGPRRALAIALAIALAALVGAALAVLAGSLPALLTAQFVLGVAARLSQVSSTLAGTRGPVAARSEGTASALLTATRQCGSALGVAIVSATLIAMTGNNSHRTATAMFITAGFALLGLLATRVVPPAPPRPHPEPQPEPEPHHLFRHHAGGIP